jgi:hypothetical protein
MAEADIFNRFEPKQGYYSEKNKVHYVRHHIKGEWVRHHNENRLGVHKAEANFQIKKKVAPFKNCDVCVSRETRGSVRHHS